LLSLLHTGGLTKQVKLQINNTINNIAKKQCQLFIVYVLIDKYIVKLQMLFSELL